MKPTSAALASAGTSILSVFTVHALKTDKIDAPADASAALVGFMIHANHLGKASFEAKYGRAK